MVARLVYWRLWLGVMAEKNLLPSPAPSIFPLPSGFFDLLQRKAKGKLSGYRKDNDFTGGGIKPPNSRYQPQPSGIIVSLCKN